MTDRDQINLDEERVRRPNLVKVAEYLAACNARTQAVFLTVITAFAMSGESMLDDIPVGVITEACRASEEAAL